MCWCDPAIRTPFCGRPLCGAHKQTLSTEPSNHTHQIRLGIQKETITPSDHNHIPAGQSVISRFAVKRLPLVRANFEVGDSIVCRIEHIDADHVRLVRED